MKHILFFYRFNTTVRKKYLDAFDERPWEEMVKDRGASFGSILDVYIHMLGAHSFWSHVMDGKDPDKFKGTDFRSIRSMDDLRKLEADVDGTIERTLRGITAENLEDEFEIRASRDKMTAESILLHMIEEELQHLGEINCLFWQMGIEPPHLKEAAS